MKDSKNYDLRLGRFGPYNKDYLGVCHIADEEVGATFNVELFPGFFRRSILTSHSICDQGLKIWGSNANLTHFVYRYEMEWKDRVYCDVDFIITDDKHCDISCKFVNNTDIWQTVNMNLCASLQYPAIKNGTEFVCYKKICKAILSNGCVFIDAVDYEDICCNQTLASDGKYIGEVEYNYATGFGTSISGQFFNMPHHFLKYVLADIEIDSIGIRYIAKEDTIIKLTVNSDEYIVKLPSTDNFGYVSVATKQCKARSVSIGAPNKAITIDCVCAGIGVKDVKFINVIRHLDPQRSIEDNRIILKYPDVDNKYIIEWYEPLQIIRRLFCNDPGVLLKHNIHDHISNVFKSANNSEGIYENLLTNPVFLNPGEHRTIKFRVTSEKPGIPRLNSDSSIYEVRYNKGGEKYAFSQNMMAYNTFLNVVYPIYTRRRFIRHNTPGRNWDSLYSWDSGFIGMGLATSDFDRAYDCLYAYLTPVDDRHSPYIFHGSVVPTQIFLYNELILSYPEKMNELAALYPMIKQYYNFYSHLDEDSTQMKSGLLKTWHIFYNSGGWDDYPPQKALFIATNTGESINYRVTTPVITTAITVLIAKIMKHISAIFGIDEDTEEYTSDIIRYSEVIQKNLWDDEVGYFSYMVHDENGEPKEFYRYKDGTNYNMGFDGIYPYIAGICTDYQKKRILDNINNGMMTSIGIGVVDRRAPYYSPFGYWNGSVWMPHQWILWKSLFDMGEIQLAHEIATKALDVWSREVDESYSCSEHFMSTNGRGCGFHQFSGLSTPVLMFFSAYFIPGTITVGFDTAISNIVWNEEKTEVSFRFTANGDIPYAQICLKEGNEYKFNVDGNEVSANRIEKSTYVFALQKSEKMLDVFIYSVTDN